MKLTTGNPLALYGPSTQNLITENYFDHSEQHAEITPRLNTVCTVQRPAAHWTEIFIFMTITSITVSWTVI